MNRCRVSAWPLFAASAGTAALLSACLAPTSSGPSERAGTASAAEPLVAQGALSPECERDESAGPKIAADDCPGAGAPRLLVQTTGGHTCGDLVASVSALAPGVVGSSQFTAAPPAVRDRFCVLDDASGSSSVTQLFAPLCASGAVQLVVHDCSPGDFTAGQGQVVASKPGPHTPATAPADGTTADPDGGPHSCDTCATVMDDALYVELPASMTAKAPSTMVVRILDGSQPDRAVLPPVGSQSFVVPKLAAPNGAPVRVYAPGETPPAR